MLGTTPECSGFICLGFCVDETRCGVQLWKERVPSDQTRASGLDESLEAQDGLDREDEGDVLIFKEKVRKKGDG